MTEASAVDAAVVVLAIDRRAAVASAFEDYHVSICLNPQRLIVFVPD